MLLESFIYYYFMSSTYAGNGKLQKVLNIKLIFPLQALATSQSPRHPRRKSTYISPLMIETHL